MGAYSSRSPRDRSRPMTVDTGAARIAGATDASRTGGLAPFLTALGKVRVKAPRVVACMCTPEPMDEDGEIEDYHESLCPIEKRLPGRLTPEVSYLCTKHGASSTYRTAARAISDITGLPRLSHMTVRHETIEAARLIEDRLFEGGWYAGGAQAQSCSPPACCRGQHGRARGANRGGDEVCHHHWTSGA